MLEPLEPERRRDSKSVLPNMNESLIVRGAERTDAPGIADIYNEGIRERRATFETRERTVDEVLKWFEDSRYPIIVAERGGSVVGWVAASSYRTRDCYAGIAEFSIYVAKGARRQGVADALMQRFLPDLSAAGFWKVLSRIFPENEGSLGLCERHGFRRVGVYQNHAQLEGVWKDVVIVERLLGAERESANPSTLNG